MPAESGMEGLDEVWIVHLGQVVQHLVEAVDALVVGWTEAELVAGFGFRQQQLRLQARGVHLSRSGAGAGQGLLRFPGQPPGGQTAGVEQSRADLLAGVAEAGEQLRGPAAQFLGRVGPAGAQGQFGLQQQTVGCGKSAALPAGQDGGGLLQPLGGAGGGRPG